MKHYTLPIIIDATQTDFLSPVPLCKRCYTQGASYDEAIANIKDAIRLHLEDHQADHEELTEEKSVSLSTVEISVGCRDYRGLRLDRLRLSWEKQDSSLHVRVEAI
jgi:predicted RNase H-like HicB family nuclease